MTLQQASQQAAFALLTFSAAAVTFFYRDFAKIKFGPLYILEALFCLWFVLAALSGLKWNWRRLTVLWGPAAFFAWGLTLLLIDISPLIFHSAVEPSRTGVGPAMALGRLLQHSLMFVYPILWSTVGLWMYYTSPKRSEKVLLAVFLFSLLDHLRWEIVINVSVGPITAIALAIILDRALAKSHSENRKIWVLPAILAFVTFVPFWKAWLVSMQRTNLILMLFMLLLVPQLIHFHDKKRWAAIKTGLKTSALAYAILGAGLFVTSLGANFYGHLPVWQRELDQRVAPLQLKLWRDIDTFRKSHLAFYYYQSAVITHNLQGKEYLGFDYLRGEPPPSAVPVPRPTPVDNEAEFRGFFADFLKSMQHGDDVPDRGDGGGGFQGRFRKFCWKTTIQDWLKSPFTGVRFVEEIPSFVGPGIPNWGGYESTGAPPVAGPHNSYLTILARMGVVGFLIFGLMSLHWLWNVRYILLRNSLGNPKSIWLLMLLFVPINGAIHALFNIGIESPHNSMLMWLVGGAALARSQEDRARRI